MRPDYYKIEVKATVDGKKRPVIIECFDLIDALNLGFYGGNAFKYVFRAGRKTADSTEDLKKCMTYIEMVLEGR